MNYRQEIDALPPIELPINHYEEMMCAPFRARLALAARIHAEPHDIRCLQQVRRNQWTGCTCGKDAAMAEVLGGGK